MKRSGNGVASIGSTLDVDRLDTLLVSDHLLAIKFDSLVLEVNLKLLCLTLRTVRIQLHMALDDVLKVVRVGVLVRSHKPARGCHLW